MYCLSGTPTVVQLLGGADSEESTPLSMETLAEGAYGSGACAQASGPARFPGPYTSTLNSCTSIIDITQ